MVANKNNSGERLAEVDNVVAAYIIAQEAGEAPDQREWLARYPQFAKELVQFFGADEHFHQVAAPPEIASTEPFCPPTEDYRGPIHEVAADPLSLQPARASRETLGPGSTLAGRYRIFRRQGGRHGRVYLADDLDCQKKGQELKRAIKTVRDFDNWQTEQRRRGKLADKSEYAVLLERFHREALAWVKLGTHENIIYAMAVIEVGGKPYLVMEYADGGDLAALISLGPLSVPLAVNLALHLRGDAVRRKTRGHGPPRHQTCQRALEGRPDPQNLGFRSVARRSPTKPSAVLRPLFLRRIER